MKSSFEVSRKPSAHPRAFPKLSYPGHLLTMTRTFYSASRPSLGAHTEAAHRFIYRWIKSSAPSASLLWHYFALRTPLTLRARCGGHGLASSHCSYWCCTSHVPASLGLSWMCLLTGAARRQDQGPVTGRSITIGSNRRGSSTRLYISPVPFCIQSIRRSPIPSP